MNNKNSKAREERKLQAELQTSIREHEYKDYIHNAFHNSKIYKEDTVLYRYKNKVLPKFYLIDTDAVFTLIMGYNWQKEHIAVLNFVSYKHPGGGYIVGSKAQEEDLCRESFLYNVLKRFENTFYEENKLDLNDSLYKNRGIYTPNILFERNVLDGKACRWADVITVACPNKKAYLEKHNEKDELDGNKQALISRCHFILTIAHENNVKNLVLGAYGCGVFGQDPTEVTTIWKYLFDEYDFGIEKVIFAIPDKESVNYKAFRDVFSLYLKEN